MPQTRSIHTKVKSSTMEPHLQDTFISIYSPQFSSTNFGQTSTTSVDISPLTIFIHCMNELKTELNFIKFIIIKKVSSNIIGMPFTHVCIQNEWTYRNTNYACNSYYCIKWAGSKSPLIRIQNQEELLTNINLVSVLLYIEEV